MSINKATKINIIKGLRDFSVSVNILLLYKLPSAMISIRLTIWAVMWVDENWGYSLLNFHKLHPMNPITPVSEWLFYYGTEMLSLFLLVWDRVVDPVYSLTYIIVPYFMTTGGLMFISNKLSEWLTHSQGNTDNVKL